ncbi:MAG: glycoside hydrolase family 92 protein [Prevotella sp.]|nr:glycoside hydrolase family 92 protein [Prevotella sp.]
MKTSRKLFATCLLATFWSTFACAQEKALTSYVNPFLGTATLWDEEDLQYVLNRKTRTWGGETFPGASLPNAMVQCSPVTMWRSGAGYQYEDTVIQAFAHTNKGHWNLLHVPIMPVCGNRWSADDFSSPYSHDSEEAHPGYYKVHVDRYAIDVELTTTLRCAVHRYSYNRRGTKAIVLDLGKTNNQVRDWNIRQTGFCEFTGNQNAEGNMYFYGMSSAPIKDIKIVPGRRNTIAVVEFIDSNETNAIELRIGFSFVNVENAVDNFNKELSSDNQKTFEQVRKEADQTWQQLLAKIEIEGGTEREKGLFYSCLYRSMLWPVLRSDCNGDYRDAHGTIIHQTENSEPEDRSCMEGMDMIYGAHHPHAWKTGGVNHYYTDPSFWDDHRNKLVLLELLRPDVASDVIWSCIDRGEKRGGYMPTFFHGDHASTFISGAWLRGIKDFPLDRAYKLLLKNATVPGHGGRPYLDEYLQQGWIAEKDTTDVPFYNEYKAAVTKTIEYAYDDYATALVARELGDKANEKLLLEHSKNYKNVFDPSTGFYRGRIADGSFIKQFDPYYPYFAYQYREANAWNNLFYAPHDPKGVLALYPSKRAVEQKLDSLFTEPWRGYEVENLTGFIGNYCHGNQPGHSIPYMYYFVDRQEKAQEVIDSIMSHYYDMGQEHLALAGMDDAGEMSSWYVFNAIGLYTYSPADPEYIVTVPLFDRVRFHFSNGKTLTIRHEGKGRRIKSIQYDGRKLKGWFVKDALLKQGKALTIRTNE